ncbi:hypothetical protein EJ110_NYTH46822 [Nymphaea thermarum]|nr:hypothetical protein EJ110_NYTH46822 [Nymphaea thermarum]
MPNKGYKLDQIRIRTRSRDPSNILQQLVPEPSENLDCKRQLGGLITFPLRSVTVFLCGMAIALLGNVCHAPTLMLANFVATPIELSLVVPFLRFGEIVTGGPHFPLTTDALRKFLTGEASRDVLISIYHALLGWLIAAPVILAVLYVLFFPCFKYLIRKFSIPSAPSAPLYSLSEVSAKARKPPIAATAAANAAGERHFGDCSRSSHNRRHSVGGSSSALYETHA